MQMPLTYDGIHAMTDEEVAALNRKLNRRAMRNVAIFVGVKVAIAYGMHRWAKSLEKTN